jgi:hypothetical protein
MTLPQRRTSSTRQDWRTLYRIENPADVDAYVAEHPSVEPILAEAPEQIRAVFHSELAPTLSINWDPGNGDCWLVVGMPSIVEGPAVLPLIDEFDERWWLDRMRDTDAVIAFDTVRL